MKSVTVVYGIEEVTKQFNDNATIQQIVSNSSVKASLGYGDNIKALQNGVELPMTAQVASGTRLVLETACNSKAQDTKFVTIKYGVEQVRKSFPYGATVDEITDTSAVQAALGYGDNVKVLLNGVELPGTAVAPNDSTLVVETRCNSKAS